MATCLYYLMDGTRGVTYIFNTCIKDGQGIVDFDDVETYYSKI